MALRLFVLGLVLLLSAAPIGAVLAEARSPTAGEPGTLTVQVHLTQKKGANGPWSIVPDAINVEDGTSVVFEVSNDGTDVHTLRIGPPYNISTPPLLPTQKAKLGPVGANLSAGVTTATVDYWCSIPGHRMLGMSGSMVISAGSNGTNATAPSAARGTSGGSASSPSSPAAAVAVLGLGGVFAAAVGLGAKRRRQARESPRTGSR
jgi:nitrite reductase (NO-forming)